MSRSLKNPKGRAESRAPGSDTVEEDDNNHNDILYKHMFCTATSQLPRGTACGARCSGSQEQKPFPPAPHRMALIAENKRLKEEMEDLVVGTWRSPCEAVY